MLSDLYLHPYITYMDQRDRVGLCHPSCCRASTVTAANVLVTVLLKPILFRVILETRFLLSAQHIMEWTGKGSFCHASVAGGFASLPVSSTPGLLRGWVLLKHFPKNHIRVLRLLFSPCELFQEPMAVTQAEVTWKPSGEVMWKCFVKM